MVFAVSASFLWVITVFYSAGYMRGLNEHEQTRFNTCFALALFGAIGCAFSDNLLTLYLFYEIVSICTYPLVAHHQDEESYESGKKYLTYLTATAKGLILPAMVADLRPDGEPRLRQQHQHRHPAPGRQPLGGHGALRLLHPRLRQERRDALPQLAPQRHGRAHARSARCSTPSPWSRSACSPPCA